MKEFWIWYSFIQKIICTLRLYNFSICLKVAQERDSYSFAPKIFVSWQELSECIADVLNIIWLWFNAAHMQRMKITLIWFVFLIKTFVQEEDYSGYDYLFSDINRISEFPGLSVWQSSYDSNLWFKTPEKNVLTNIYSVFLLTGGMLFEFRSSYCKSMWLWHSLPSHLWAFLHPRQMEMLWCS